MKKLLYVLSAAALLSGCVKNNPDPSWIEINEWTLEANGSNEEGQLTQKITNAWVYVNDNPIGAFELPVKVPVLTSGSTNIKVYPAVLNNGISATKKIYPFMDFYEVDTQLNQNETFTITPTTQYKSGLSWTYMEDFEGVADTMEDDPNSLSQGTTTAVSGIMETFNDGQVYHVTIDSQDSTWVAYTTWDALLPGGQEVYLELDYYNTNRATVGVLGIGPNGVDENPYIQLNTQANSEAEWKHIYIDLREIVSNSPDAEYFNISFEANIDDDKAPGQINIDNLKLVHF